MEEECELSHGKMNVMISYAQTHMVIFLSRHSITSESFGLHMCTQSEDGHVIATASCIGTCVLYSQKDGHLIHSS